MMTQSDFKSLVAEIAPMIAGDPRPRATIRVGAIGHRNIDGATGPAALGDAMLRIARLLLHDVDGWRELFSGKHLET
jgi:hypothetical protein